MFPTEDNPSNAPEAPEVPDETDDKREASEGEQSEQQTIEIYVGVLQDNQVEISDPSAADSLHQQSYFGEQREDGKLALSPEEVLVLFERKRLQVLGADGEELTFDTLVKHFSTQISDLWLKYIVYRDLRTRGYIVRRGMGDGIDWRVYKRGAKKGLDEAKYLIFTVVEGKPLELRVLDKITKYSISSRKKLVLAVVDRLGEITYYSVDQYNLK